MGFTDRWWWNLAQCLTASAPETFPDLSGALERACASGATPFEVIAGAPVARYGARVTLQHASRETLARAFALDAHPWGTPRWIGIRASPGRPLRVKPYHLVDRLDARFDLPADWPDDLYPLMASLDGGAVEIYLRKKHACGFRAFATRCFAPLAVAPPAMEPTPRPLDDAFGVSLRREDGRITAVSVYANWRALPRDRDVERIWSASLEPQDRAAYELALAGVRSLGFLPSGNWHAMLAWTADAAGEHHRAVSLSAPPLAMPDPARPHDEASESN